MKCILLLLAILSLVVVNIQATCQWTSPSGIDYDFSASTLDEVRVVADDSNTYSFSFCGAKPSNKECANVQHSPTGCIYNSERLLLATARWDDTSALTPVITERTTGGLSLEFNNGDTFPTGSVAKLIIDLDCGSQMSASRQDTLLPLIRLSVQHPLGCPAKNGLSGGGIFLIVFFSLFAAYFIIGFLVCKFVMKKDGLDAIPQRGFWSALPGLYFAGCKTVIGKIRGKKGGSSGYEDPGTGDVDV